ncbi:MAG TPA: tRNA (adenosine(37)-N6)-dimethylallyltransferase MiaA [Rhizomicrobium sp.]|nr:tRNA (adenosine(37)-N6)-dimethylallyltransferase MiaA [Rhizomicrobium sp.]
MTFDAVLIAGPTASSKSAAALALAERIGGAVINADSMQVYAEAPILTAQPDAAAKARVPHLLYGHVPAREVYSVGRYAEDAARALQQVQSMSKLPIFAGGTGMYFMALEEGLATIPPIPDDIRAAARTLLDEIGVEALHARLAARDPETAAGLRPTDPQRTLRAWEVWCATGRPLVEWQSAPSEPILKDMKLARILLDPPREQLRAAIAARFEAMVHQGGLAEARALEGLEPSLPAAKLLGLRPLQALARGEISEKAAISEAVTATRQFAKRQMTWFRGRMPHYVRFDPAKSNIITIFNTLYA